MAGHSTSAEELSCEGYGPGGGAVLLSCRTDDQARTVAAVRAAFRRHGGHLGAAGSVSYLFHAVGVLAYRAPAAGVAGAELAERADLADLALQFGAEDVTWTADGGFEVETDPRDLGVIAADLLAHGYAPTRQDVLHRAASRVELDAASCARLAALVADLREVAGVQRVDTNVLLPDALRGAA
jgi:transcriptional/translational regulatory protein YebC/TACO1